MLKSKTFLVVILAFVGVFRPAHRPATAETASSSSAIPRDGACRTNEANDIEYLTFWGPYPGNAPDPLDRIGPLAAKLGTTGDGKTRQLGFGPGIPIWVTDESSIALAIQRAFDTAKRTNVAAHFVVDDHVGWDERPDLWNWYDPAKPGYNTGNKKNVEWYDWEGTPNKRRYLTPNGVPSQSPHMCYNSPALKSEISRIVLGVVGPALRKEIDKLELENKEYLFAGVTVGAEAGFDDYSTIPKLYQILPTLPKLVQTQERMTLTEASTLMDEDKAPYGRLGYCSLTNAGYSKTNPPQDFKRALKDVNQSFIEFWDKLFFDAGIPCARIYTHIAASAPQDESNDAPIRMAFNPYARPGWTTYPTGTLENGFQPLYDELAKHGNPPWGGVEANAAFVISNPAVSWEEYLAWHYNHGAKLVGINVGATEQSLMSHLTRGAFSDEAIAAYRKFLNGAPLSEVATTVAPSPSDNTTVIALPPEPPQLVVKMHAIQRDAPAWLKAHPDRESEVGPLFQQLDDQIRANNTVQAQQTADMILQVIGTNPPAN